MPAIVIAIPIGNAVSSANVPATADPKKPLPAPKANATKRFACWHRREIETLVVASLAAGATLGRRVCGARQSRECRAKLNPVALNRFEPATLPT